MARSRYLAFIISLFLLAACGGGGGLPGNINPTANAGSADIVDEGDMVQLQGIGVDLDGSIASYLWTQTSGPSVTLSDNSITNPTFTAPQVSAQTNLIFNLTVTDDDGATDTDGVIITVNDTNTPPTANAGADDSVDEGLSYQLSGMGTDAEGAVTYSWSQVSGTAVVLSNILIANPSFTAPQVGADEPLVFRLTVSDTDGATATSDVTITVNDLGGNTPPTVNAGPDQSVTEGDTVQLDGSGSDAEGAVTFLWTQEPGTTVTLSNTTIANPTFTAPQVSFQEVLTFTLTVTDGDGASVMESVNITVNDTPIPPTGSYLFYSHDLNAVDPATPTAPAFIESAANILDRGFGFTSSAELLRIGAYNPATNVVTDSHTHALMYANSTDGRLYKVNGLIGGGTTPVQVSNESQADEICLGASGDSSTRGDVANPDNSVYVYALPAPATTCANEDYVWKAVRFGMNSATAPIAAKEPVEELHDLATGAISGWLVHDAGQLQRCDANFASCTNIVAVTDSVNSIIQTSLNRSLLEIDSELYVYDAGADLLSPSRFTIPTNTVITIPASDGTTVYFGNGQDLYSMPADGSAAATVFYNETADVQHRVVLTANKVIYQTGTSGLTTNLKALPKAPGGTPILLANATGSDHIVQLFSNTNYIYYNIQNFNTGGSFAIIPVLAGVVDENGGSKTETANAAWVGGALGTSFDFNQGSDFGWYAETMILAEGFDIPATSGGYATATLRSVNAATAVVGVTLGVMPDGEKVSGLNCFSVGPDILCGSANEINPAPTPPAITFQYDIFYLHATTTDSLRRVTTTPAQSEVLVF